MQDSIAAICATPEELAALKGEFPPERIEHHVALDIYHYGNLSYALAGIGKVNATIAATILGLRNPKAIIFSGVSGGVGPDLDVGSIVLGSSFVQVDFGLQDRGQFKPTSPGTCPIEYEPLIVPMVSDEVQTNLLLLQSRIDNSHVGRILTADYFLNDPVLRDQLYLEYSALAFDMESAAVATTGDAFGIPVYVIRTLSDRAGEEGLTTYSQLASTTAEQSARAVKELLQILG